MRPKKYIYLDHAAATPIDAKIKKIIDDAQQEAWANPSSTYSLGRNSNRVLEGARKAIAAELGAKQSEILFTSGSTESANLAIMGIARQYPKARIIAGTIEHEAVLGCLNVLANEGRLTGVIPVVSNGVIDPQSVVASIDDTTVLVCVMYVNNEIGTIQPIAKIYQHIKQIRDDRSRRGISLPLYLYCDAAQAGMQTITVSRLGVDLLSMGGSKLYGPRESGFLYVRTGVALKPVTYGGNQENGLRSGTPNVPGAVGLAAALGLVQRERLKEGRRQAELRDELWYGIRKVIPEAFMNGDSKTRIGANLNICLPEVSGEALVAYMNSESICIATGSACTAANENPSHVLTSIGLTALQAQSSIRISLGRSTNKKEINACVKAMMRSVHKLQAHNN